MRHARTQSSDHRNDTKIETPKATGITGRDGPQETSGIGAAPAEAAKIISTLIAAKEADE